jgi:hypothetical protein
VVDFQTVSIGVASASIVIAVLYYIVQIRHQTRTRDTELVTKLYSTFSRREFQRELHELIEFGQSGASLSDFLEKYGSIATETSLFFEELGVLLNRKLIDISLVDDLFTGFIIRFWEAVKPIVEEGRKKLNYPEYGEWMEYLYNEMKKRLHKLQHT